MRKGRLDGDNFSQSVVPNHARKQIVVWRLLHSHGLSIKDISGGIDTIVENATQ